VLTSGGDYYWIGFDQIQKMDFLPPQRPRDLLWRRVRLSVRQGPEGDVFVPVLYWNSHKAEVNDLRIGRQTCWDDSAFPLVRGQGQRCFLIGEVDQPVMSLTTVSFADVTG
jgi:type VI secretion system protein ImpE